MFYMKSGASQESQQKIAKEETFKNKSDIWIGGSREENGGAYGGGGGGERELILGSAKKNENCAFVGRKEVVAMACGWREFFGGKYANCELGFDDHAQVRATCVLLQLLLWVPPLICYFNSRTMVLKAQEGHCIWAFMIIISRFFTNLPLAKIFSPISKLYP